MRTAAPWIVLGAATAAASFALSAVGLPSPTLFAALLVGLAAALAGAARPAGRRRTGRSSPRRPCAASRSAPTCSRDALQPIAGSWLPVLLVSAAHARAEHRRRLACSRASPRLDTPTATLGMIAGGASGIVGMADDLGGDDRLVAFMQYLRVLIVVLVTPLLVTGSSAAGDGIGRGAGRGAVLGDPAGLADHRGRRAVGAVVGRRVRDARRHPARADGRWPARSTLVRRSASSSRRSCASSRSR